MTAVDQETGFSAWNADDPATAILVSVPHSGRDYPVELTENLRIPAAELIRLEDRFADLLVSDIRKAGFPTIIAHKARAWIDLNRAETDIDPEILANIPAGQKFSASAKQRGGLGLVPSRLSGVGAIWKSRFAFEAVRCRIEDYYRPYHRKLDDILQQMRRKFGMAVMLDVHSMPSIRDYAAGAPPQFVVGDRFGGSAASRFAEMVQAQIAAAGFNCSLNHPYSGDHILRQHGKPRRDIHAIQLEVDRSLYLDAMLREPGEGLGEIAILLFELAQMLASEARGEDILMAAE